MVVNLKKISHILKKMWLFFCGIDYLFHFCLKKTHFSRNYKTNFMKKTKVIIDNEKLQVSSDLLRALAHPLRLKILEFIDKYQNINVNKIYHTLKIEQSITSQHLRILRSSGVVFTEKEGKYVNYHINYEMVDKAIKALNNFYA